MQEAKNKKQFKVIVEQSDDGYFVASVPALPGCHTQAKTLEQLNKRVREAIVLCLEVAKTDLQYRQRIKQFSSEPVFIGLETVIL
jgi:predicted RNase H-like HicB family nuclease